MDNLALYQKALDKINSKKGVTIHHLGKLSEYSVNLIRGGYTPYTHLEVEEAIHDKHDLTKVLGCQYESLTRGLFKMKQNLTPVALRKALELYVLDITENLMDYGREEDIYFVHYELDQVQIFVVFNQHHNGIRYTFKYANKEIN